MTFGCFFFDYDLDGWLDIFAANGHVADDIERVQKRVTYAQAPHLFRNQRPRQVRGGDGGFRRGARGADGRRAAPPTPTTISTAISTSS